LILLFARNLVLLGENFGGLAHDHFRQRAEEAIAIHGVDEFLIAEAVAPASALEVIRNSRHGFGAAGEHAIEIAGGDFLEAEGDRLEARGTCFIDGVGRGPLRHAAADGDLAGGVRASAGLASVAEDRFFYLFWRDGGALDSGFGGDDTHIGGGERSK